MRGQSAAKTHSPAHRQYIDLIPSFGSDAFIRVDPVQSVVNRL
jgi:hypothetical protein